MKKLYLCIILLLAGVDVAVAQMAAPTLNSPSDGYVYPSTVKPNLKLNSVSGASYYMIQWSEDPTFVSCREYTFSSSYTGLNVNGLKFGTTYYWRAYAISANYADTSASSEVRSFTTTSAPTLTAPTDGIVLSNSISPTLKWTELVGATHYIYQCDTTPQFNSSLLETFTQNGYNSAGCRPLGLKYGKTYYLRMKATNTDDSDTSAWSAVRSFTTSSTVTLSSPTNGIVYSSSVQATVEWTSLTGAGHFILAWDTASTFDSPLYETFVTTGRSVNIFPIKFGTKYYWRVRATNNDDSDTSAWSAVRSFTTSNAPTLRSPTNGYVYSSSVTPTLQCTAITGAGRYLYQWDTASTFDSPLFGSTGKVTYSTAIGPLKLGTTYHWRVRATNNDNSDTSSWSAIWSFTTGGSVPTLSSPSNNATSLRLRPTIQWNSVSSCDYYDYECDTTPQFNSPELQSGSLPSGTTSVRLNQLRYGTTYYWRARIRLNGDTSSWSSAWRFTTAATIALVAPTNGYTLSNSIMPTLDWDYINDGDSYEYQYDVTPDFESPELVSGQLAVGTSEIALTTPLRFETTYYWRVREYTTIDTTPWSATWHFTTPGQIALVSPANGSTNIGTSVTLDWDYIRGGTFYQYQYDVTSDFSSAELVEGSVQVGNSQATISGLEENHLYYWRVRELSAVDTTPWSEVWHFSTQMHPVFTDIYDTACGSYLWNGQTYTESGDYSCQLVSSLHADSTVTLHLTVYPIYSVPLIAAICESALPYHYEEGIIDTTFQVGTPQLSVSSFAFSTQQGCDSTVTLHLTVHSVPTVTIAGESVFCEGSSTLLIASGATAYEWNTMELGPECSVTCAGTYTVTGTDSNGCVATASITVTEVTINADIQLLEANGSNYLQVSQEDAIYQWINCTNHTSIEGETRQRYVPVVSGSYACVITVGACTDTSECIYVPQVGIASLDEGIRLLYPNPTRGLVTLELSTSIPVCSTEIQLFDVYGQLLRIIDTRNVATQPVTVDLSTYPSGVYLLKLVCDDTVLGVRKVLKD